jgi:hypothetical protein
MSQLSTYLAHIRDNIMTVSSTDRENKNQLFHFILFIPCIVIRTHTTLTKKCTLIIPCYVIEYSNSKLTWHVLIPCWDHQGLLDYKLHNYKLIIKVHIKSMGCIKVKIVGYFCWFLGPSCIRNCLFTCTVSTCKQAISDTQWTQEPTEIVYNFNLYTSYTFNMYL